MSSLIKDYLTKQAAAEAPEQGRGQHRALLPRLVNKITDFYSIESVWYSVDQSYCYLLPSETS